MTSIHLHVKNAVGFPCANPTTIILAAVAVTLLTLFALHCMIYYCKKARVCCCKSKPEMASARMQIERQLAIKRE